MRRRFVPCSRASRSSARNNWSKARARYPGAAARPSMPRAAQRRNRGVGPGGERREGPSCAEPWCSGWFPVIKPGPIRPIAASTSSTSESGLNTGQGESPARGQSRPPPGAGYGPRWLIIATPNGRIRPFPVPCLLSQRSHSETLGNHPCNMWPHHHTGRQAAARTPAVGRAKSCASRFSIEARAARLGEWRSERRTGARRPVERAVATGEEPHAGSGIGVQGSTRRIGAGAGLAALAGGTRTGQ